MINLLPPAYATRIKFGRINTTLRSWIIGSAAAIGGLLLILAGGYLYLSSQTSDLQTRLNQTDSQLQAQNLDKVKQDATTITGDIKVINQVLKSEVRFSDLIQDIGKTMPPGTTLSSLSLSQINGPLDLSINAKDYSSAAQVAINLNDPANGLFSKVDIVNINCASSSTVYQCSGTLKALFSVAAQKKYQNVPQGTQP